MSGIVGSKLNIRGSGLVGSLGTDGQHLLSSGAGKTNVFETSAAGSAGAPYFQAVMSSATQALSDASAAKVAFNVASIDSGSTYDTTNYRWTPAEDATYFVSSHVLAYADDSSKVQTISCTFNKNGSIIHYFGNSDNRTAAYGRGENCMGSIVVALDADDYIEVFATLNTTDGSAPTVNGESSQTWFNGFKIA